MAKENTAVATTTATAPVSAEKAMLSLATETTAWLLKDINNPEKNIRVPEGYSVGVEINTALLDIAQNTALWRCSKESIMTALRNMVLQGLSAAKKQCYFVPYNGQMQLQRSYFGTISTLKIAFPWLEVFADVLYEGDGYQLSVDPVYGFKSLTVTASSIDNMDNPIKAAYGYIIDTRANRRVYGMVMTWKEIQKSWSRAKTKNVQNEFPQEMAKRTLIQRMCKMYINTTPALDSNWAQAFNSTTTAEYTEEAPAPEPVIIERAQAIRTKSKGAGGLKAMVKEEVPQPEINPATGEIQDTGDGPEAFADDSGDLFGADGAKSKNSPYAQEIPF